MFYGISVNNQDYLNGASNGFNQLNVQLAGFASNFDECAPMLNKLTLLYNFVWKMFYATLALITDALSFIIGGQPMFQWAKQKFIINLHQRALIKERAFNDHIENTLHTYGYKSIDELSPGFQAKILIGATHASMMADQSIPVVDPTVFCGVVDSLISFLLNMLKLFNVFFIQIWGSIVTALFKALKNGSSLPDLLTIILLFFKNLLFDLIPFGKCLKSPLALVGCMCTPQNSGSITAVDVWVIGCMFSGCDASVYPSGFIAFQYCSGLRSALDALGVLGTVIKGLLDLIGKLDDAVGGLNKAINALSGLISNVLNILSKLEVISKMQIPPEFFEPHVHVPINHTYIHQQMGILHGVILESTAVPPFNPDHRVIFSDNDTVVENCTDSYIACYLVGKNMSDPANEALAEIDQFMKDHEKAVPMVATILNGSFVFLYKMFNLTLQSDYSMELDDIVDEVSTIDAVSIFQAFMDLSLHVDNMADKSISGNCYDGCVNCTEEKKAMCNQTISYADYLESIRASVHEYASIARTAPPMKAQYPSAEETKAALREGTEYIKQQQSILNLLKQRNTFHKAGIDIVLNIFGQSSFIALLGGLATALTCTSLCGMCCGNTLKCCTRAISCCPMIMILLASIFAAIIMNFGTNTYDNDDLVGPFMQELGPLFMDSYDRHLTPQEIAQQFNIISTLTGTALNSILIKIIRIQSQFTMFGLPLFRLPAALPSDTFMDWVEALILYPYFSACVTSDDCPRNGVCFRIRDIHNPNAYCTKECIAGDDCSDVLGQCIILPFIQPGFCMNEYTPQFNVFLRPECGNITHIPIYDLDYTRGPVWQKNGFISTTYLTSSEFWHFYWALHKTGWEEGLFFFRLLNADQINMSPEGIFFGQLQNVPLVSLPGMSSIQFLTVATHFLVPPLQQLSYRSYNIVNTPSFEPFPTLASQYRFINVDDEHPFGHATASMVTCEIAYGPPGIIGIVLIAVDCVIIATILFAPLFPTIFRLLIFFIITVLGGGVHGLKWLYRKLKRCV